MFFSHKHSLSHSSPSVLFSHLIRTLIRWLQRRASPGSLGDVSSGVSLISAVKQAIQPILRGEALMFPCRSLSDVRGGVKTRLECFIHLCTTERWAVTTKVVWHCISKGPTRGFRDRLPLWLWLIYSKFRQLLKVQKLNPCVCCVGFAHLSIHTSWPLRLAFLLYRIYSVK